MILYINTGLMESFNRNIVECKVEIWEKDEDGELGFNRNIVECKV